MKISIIGPTYPYKGGISHYNTILCKNLAKKHDIQLISFKKLYPKLLTKLLLKSKEFKENVSQDKIGFNNFPIINSTNPLTWYKAYKKIKKFNPDLLILYWWTPFWTIFDRYIVKKLHKKTKIIFLCHNVIPHEKSKIDTFLTKQALSKVKNFIVHSKSDKKELLNLFPRVNVKVSPHPTYDIFYKDIKKEKAKSQLGLKGKIILFFGYVRKYKGLEVLIKALPDVLKKINLTLLIVGEFWNKEEYFKLIKDLKLEKNVKIIDGYVPNEDVAMYYSCADMLVLPYHSATNSGIVQTAFAFNKPAIVTNVGGLPEIVTNNKTGLVVSKNDYKALAKAIIKFYKNNLEKKFVKNIKKEKDKFSWNRMVETIESFHK